MALEEHPEAFFERFEAVAGTFEVLPVPYGYPLLELVTPEGVLPVFDRGAPPIEGGRFRVLIHGVVLSFEPRKEPAYVRPLPTGRTRLSGAVEADLGEGFFHVAATVPVLVHAPEALKVGERYVFDLAPPLMGFRP